MHDTEQGHSLLHWATPSGFLTFSTSSFTRCVQMVVLQEPFLIVAYARCRGSEDFVKLLRGTVLMVVKNFQGLHNRPYSAWTALNAG